VSERNDQPVSDVLDHAIAALRATEGSGGPPPRLVASTIEALQNLDQGPDFVRFPEKRNRMFTLLRYSGVAAVLMLAVGLWGLDRNAGLSFAQVVENVQNAKSVQFELKQKFGHQPELKTCMALQGDLVRYEIPDMLILTMDTKEKKGLELDVPVKVARVLDSAKEIPAKALKDPIDRLRNLKQEIKDEVDRLPDEKIDGNLCQVYQVKGHLKETKNRPTPLGIVPDQFKLWVDAKTGLPVQIVAQGPETLLVYEKFQWDVPIAESQFSTKIPQGYRIEEPLVAALDPNRIYYQQGWVALYSVQPDGQKPQEQFVPRLVNSPDTYVADKAELSPDGRYLAMAYTHTTKNGSYPPYRVLLWDRTHPGLDAVEVYARPEGELQSWQFSPDGKRLFVNWWQHVAGKPMTEGREGTDVVDVATKFTVPVKLPSYRDAQGHDQEMRFAAASADGQSYLVVGQGLHVANATGQLGRRLGPADARIFIPSVRLSGDGTQAIYVTQQPDNSQKLWIVSLTDGLPRELIPASKYTDVRARWAPDGSRIAYSCRQFDPTHGPFFHGKETYLYLVPSGGGEAEILKSAQVGPNGPSLQLTAWR
jgi:hypothetical protein